MNLVGAKAFWEEQNGYSGEGQVIEVIDNGVDYGESKITAAVRRDR